MSEKQHDLFQPDPGLGQLLSHMDNVPAGELKHQWPQMLVAQVDVMDAKLARQGISEPRDMARRLAVALAHYMGGRSYYLPFGDRMLNALRDDMIYCAFSGRNIEALRREHRLSQTQIYAIIAQQRALHQRRHQHALF